MLRLFLRVLLIGASLSPAVVYCQTVTTFEGIDASDIAQPKINFDPNGAVGTKQYLEWVNDYFQAYDKVTFAPVWSSPRPANASFQNNNQKNCYGLGGDGFVNFDRLASRWVIAVHNIGSNSGYYYCVAVSNTGDLTSPTLAWYTYQFQLTPYLGTNWYGHVYFPDWPKIGTWANAYYVSFDLEDPDNQYREIGIVACALDRTNMLLGNTANPIQCFSDPSPIPMNAPLYLRHSLIPGDIEGTTPPPSGRDEFFLGIQNPPNDGQSTTSTTVNLWDFHLDWVTPSNSTFTNSAITVPAYTPGCYNVSRVAKTTCVPEPSSKTTHNYIDSVGDRLMPRFSYRNFGTYESFLVSHTVQTNSNGQTGIRWYQLQGNGSGLPVLYQTGTISPGGKFLYRFLPSIAQDSAGNAAVGYSDSSPSIHPGILASWWNLPSSGLPAEVSLFSGTADEENNSDWGSYSSMTVDPVDGCTFWYSNEYYVQNQTGSMIDWNTRISTFKIPTCPGNRR